jgi:flagellar motor switch protein FliN
LVDNGYGNLRGRWSARHPSTQARIATFEMAELTPEHVAEVVAACRGSAEDIVGSLTRALDGQIVGVTIEEPGTYDPSQPLPGHDGPGLAITMKFGASTAVVLLPESSGLLPPWYTAPDATGKSKLSTLAQELSMLVVPASLAADEFQAFRVEAVTAALLLAEVAPGASHVPIALKSEDKQGHLSIIWPVPKPGEMMPKAAAPEVAPLPSAKPEAKPTPPAVAAAAPAPPATHEFSNLPKYTRSVFKVKVPVSVNLASQKQSVQDIIGLVPGSIIKFDKSCDELLDLVVGDQPIAAGEVVKVGDKFGLRIRNIILPQEQFVAIKTSMAS